MKYVHFKLYDIISPCAWLCQYCLLNSYNIDYDVGFGLKFDLINWCCELFLWDLMVRKVNS